MTHTLTETEQAELRVLLQSPLMRKALSDALGSIQLEKRAATSLEACAMAYNHNEGAMDLVSKLFAMGDVKLDLSVKPQRLRKITN